MNTPSDMPTTRRVGWAADIHLNFVDPTMRPIFCDSIRDADLDALVLAGDISVARYKDIGVPRDLAKDIQALTETLGLPVYLSLGNHDWWFSGIEPVRQQLLDILSKNPLIHWLERDGVVSLGKETALIGVDSWADEPWDLISQKPKDWIYIDDFVGLSTEERLALSKRLALQAAAKLTQHLTDAVRGHSVVFVVSHIPPLFPDSTSPQALSHDSIARWLGSASCGAAISSVAADHPHAKFVVLSGHLHARMRQQITHNIEVRIAAAKYYEPSLEDVLIV